MSRIRFWRTAVVSVVTVAVGVSVVVGTLWWHNTQVERQFAQMPLAQQVENISSDLRAPDDPSTVAESSLGNALEIRKLVMLELEHGASRDEVLKSMIQMYGPSVLAVPEFYGFGRWVWITPGLLIILLASSVFIYLKVAVTDDSKLDKTQTLEERALTSEVEVHLRDFM
ncbi:cytochrome c-type biogenesis protein CcmH [Alicyclobacillus curvatus]|nr:cytochrome c-type biogenesis protein CcmH [Alicyclobacillus curvatus]